MIYQTECGLYLKLIFQADKVDLAVMQGIIGKLLMLLSGFYVLVLLVEIYRPRMGTGKIHIADFADKGAHHKSPYSNRCTMIQTQN